MVSGGCRSGAGPAAGALPLPLRLLELAAVDSTVNVGNGRAIEVSIVSLMILSATSVLSPDTTRARHSPPAAVRVNICVSAQCQ